MTSIAAAPTRVFSDRPSQPGFDRRLEPIAERIHAGQRLSREDGLLLYQTSDIWTVCSLADFVRRKLHGDIAYYNVNRHLNYSNICALSCKFCAFYRKKDQDGAYEHSIDQVREEARKARDSGATEIHIVGGLHPWLPFEYYLDMMRAIREGAPQIHIKAFTAVEIVHLARISRRVKGGDGGEGIRSVLSDLRDAGLGSLPGGGAEVFDDRVHDEAFKGKIRGPQWLDVHRIAHELGINSNATMLYGHVEQREERINHMLMLRQAQDAAIARGNGAKFQTIIPLPFFPDASELERLPAPTGLENLRTLAICRLMLDNFPHVKAFWIMQTLNMAQFMLQNGADDIDGTVVWYDITKVQQGGGAESAGTHQEVGVFELQRAIREAGFRPVERDTLYRPVIREGARWRVGS
jgi:aminodeoxyfutalosine synthase